VSSVPKTKNGKYSTIRRFVGKVEKVVHISQIGFVLPGLKAMHRKIDLVDSRSDKGIAHLGN
jgi:hypothetical protein